MHAPRPARITARVSTLYFRLHSKGKRWKARTIVHIVSKNILHHRQQESSPQAEGRGYGAVLILMASSSRSIEERECSNLKSKPSTAAASTIMTICESPPRRYTVSPSPQP
mmetsp:Transcript_5785/g.18063  ORF Transcript_5785/g.18063 Transcript_5785/m.18063 type:complete len:111 (+) Transcript_5785:352-684(+)